MTERVGVLGGTFDPIHSGHLALAAAARECADLDSVLLVPAARPAHRGVPGAPPDDRLAMARAAAAGVPWIRVWDGELKRPGTSYTADTLAELKASIADAELFLVLGWDAAREISSWHRPETVLRLATVVLVDRPGLPTPSRADLAAAGLDPASVIRCAVLTPDVSATSLRHDLAAGADVGDRVPAPVLAYIRAHRLYGGADSG